MQPKGEIPDPVHVTYANNSIARSADLAGDIVRDLIATADSSPYHSSESFASEGFELTGLSLLNVDNAEIAPERGSLPAIIYDHVDDASGRRHVAVSGSSSSTCSHNPIA